ncbi:putative FBD-associated F-box protein At5g56690 [Cornus florida]|uniref:putative FBD-associated F-box protein At5g56690 n=1 Tax=Cornus florida TaxID=4283 RepID=UPI00289B8BD1|nr:putative FBD-associated F-box protein At5g56690 [Cornus florida]XP_059662123.1 putative FBD-associated F-box protein At5g56690 [Cornus florida]
MRKIARCTSSFKQQKTKEQHTKDGISGLPDEILIDILSLLTLKEAACSSILSRRWRYLWRHTTGSFNFDLNTLLGAPTERIFLCSEHEEKRTTYTNWVNEVLKLHLGTRIDEMRIYFDFRDQYPHDINDWIKFAMEKGAQRFELNVLGYTIPGQWRTFYNFSSVENFKILFRTSHSHHVSRSIGSAAGFCSLTALRLVGVDITEEMLENFLFNCPFLEQLGIVGTKCLVNLKISGPSLKLKCLEISQCLSLENLEISAINLVSFAYKGRETGVHFKNVPLLSELSIGGEFCPPFVFGCCKHSSSLPQIEKLKLKYLQEIQRFPKYCRDLGNLKQVEFFFVGSGGDCLLSFTSVIKASPNLSKFSVRMHLAPVYREIIREVDERTYLHAVKEATKCHHQCLKVVELCGFNGISGSEVELVLHILEIAASLEKIIIDTRLVIPSEFSREAQIEAARERARQLKTRLPATIELVIL